MIENSFSKALALSIAAYCLACNAAAMELASPDLTGRKYFYGSAASFDTHENPQLQNPDGSYGFAVGYGSRHSRHVAWEAEIFWDHQRVDTPFNVPPSGPNSRASIESYGLAGNIRLLYPLGRIEPYVGAGIGIYHAALESSQATLTARVNKSDNGIGLQLLAGVEYYFGDSGNSVGIQYRRLKLEVSFGPEVAGTVDVGGDFLFLMFRRTF